MKNKRTKKGLQAGLALGILVVLIMPMSIISATDNTPPVIDPNSLYFDPPLYVGPLGDSYVYVMCIVTDNVAVADVRLVITGPGGYQSNESCSPGYYYEGFVQPLPSYGTYASHVFAIDTSGNTVVSDTFYSLIMENPLPYVYVDNDAVFPFDGSSAHPFPTITLGLSAVGVNGTVFVRNGFYHENVWMASTINLIGESKENVIIQAASGYDQAIKFGLYVNHSSVSNVTIQGGIISGILFELANNNTVHNCIIRNNPTGIFVGVSPYNTITNCDIINNGVGILMYSYEAANSFYHNNFINNTVHVGGTMNANTWDNGVTGNYWDDYRTRYPNAHIMTETQTWGTTYMIATTNGDHHPWVYSYGASNQPPNTPQRPTGPIIGVTESEYTFSTTTKDNDNTQVSYWFNWGDNTTSGWLGLNASGATVTTRHRWTTEGTYQITVKAKDQDGAESSWSPAASITLSESQPPTNRLVITAPTSVMEGQQLQIIIRTTNGMPEARKSST